MRGQPQAKYTPARPITSQFPGNGCMDDLTAERSFASPCVILMYFVFFDMLSLGICEIGHWQTSSWLLQELKVCTVEYLFCTFHGCKPLKISNYIAFCITISLLSSIQRIRLKWSLSSMFFPCKKRIIFSA